MSRYYGDWAPYVSAAERRRQAARLVVKLRRKGSPITPVTIEGRTIAKTFWGRAWCDMMESYGDYASRLPRGRSYVRNGLVIDLQIETGCVTALVSGSDVYTVIISVKQTAKTQWQSICADCSRGIESVVELLQGRLSKGVMERICQQGAGLFPEPSQIRFACTCPDHASMCKHVAAVLYGVGARLDEKPELLFRLRAVDEAELVAGIDTALSVPKSRPTTNKVLVAEDMAALFGLDMADAERPDQPLNKPARSKVQPGKDKATPTLPRRSTSGVHVAREHAAVADKAVALKTTKARDPRVPVKPSKQSSHAMAEAKPHKQQDASKKVQSSRPSAKRELEPKCDKKESNELNASFRRNRR
ncbi:SWIM zinc finger family protein [Acidisoma silvae]|uniref:SWIM-type domain-containing protein n=1 Tax=Acidisoma silvae TaxID=2802396 RepID=A0A964E1H3_9PROT|nr:hypothetical protein [Acidisoma silvae]MCB8878535.1 hypothetical protein [Acidisoma silvae]